MDAALISVQKDKMMSMYVPDKCMGHKCCSVSLPTDNHVRTCSRMPLDGQQAAEASLKPVKGWEIRRATNAGAGDHDGGHERIEWHHESGMTCKHACMESEIQPLYFGGSGTGRVQEISLHCIGESHVRLMPLVSPAALKYLLQLSAVTKECCCFGHA